MEEEGYEELYRQIDDLKRQNQILRLEHELGSFSKELGEITGHFSTPAPGKVGRLWDPRGYGQIYPRVDQILLTVLRPKCLGLKVQTVMRYLIGL